MKCPYCRAENGPNSSFCSNCGNPIHGENYETSGINQPGEYETSGVNKSGDYETSGVNQRGDYETSGVNQRGDYETSGVNQRRGYETSGVDRRGGYETSDARNTRRDGPYDPYDPYDPYVTNSDDGDYPTEEPGDVVTVIPNGGSGNILKIITIILSIIASVSVFLFALKFTGLADKIGLSSFLPFLEQDTQDIDSEEDEPKTDPKDTPIPTSSPIPTATPEPTPTPIPTPTPEPTPTPVSYPADQIQGVVQRGEVDLQNMHKLNTYNEDATSLIYQYGLPSDYNRPSRAFDDNIATNWQEGEDGPGQGHMLTCQLESGYTVSYIQMRIGNWNPDQSVYNYFAACNRPKNLIIKLDGYQQSFEFPDSKEVFTICLNHPFEASSFALILGDVYDGYEWSDTAITDIMFYGNPK